MAALIRRFRTWTTLMGEKFLSYLMQSIVTGRQLVAGHLRLVRDERQVQLSEWSWAAAAYPVSESNILLASQFFLERILSTARKQQ
jgi:hypothetical protein